MKTRILVLKHQLRVKYLIVWPRGQLLVEKTNKQTNKQTKKKQPTNLTRSRRKKTSKSHPTPSEIATFWTPVPSEFSLPSVGRVWLFSGATQFMYYSRGKYRWWILTWLQLEDKNGIHWTKIKAAYFVVKVTCNVENYYDDFSLITGHLFHVIAIRTTVDE